MEVLAISQGNLGVIGDCLIFSWTLEKENVPKRDSNTLLEVFSSLYMVFELRLLLVDEDVDSMF